MSESIEMYLVTTALLQKDQQPVPLSQLAQHLAISPVSANEMCRKLVERGLVEYQPYKGVTLTDEGATLAQRVLQRRRLWESFLMDKLGISAYDAEDIACRLEHITSDQLTSHLADFLEHCEHTCDYAMTLRGSAQEVAQERQRRALTTLTAGERGEVVAIAADDVVKDFLHGQGVAAGHPFEVLAVGADGSMLLEMGNHHLALSHTTAAHVEVVLTAAPLVNHEHA